MRAALALLAVGLLPSVAFCADAKPKTRTLKDVISLVQANGEDYEIGENIANSLGYGKAKLPAKEIYYDKSVTADNCEHVFNIVMKNSKPEGLSISRTLITESGDSKTVDAEDYRLSLNGDLVRAFKTHGPYGSVEHKPLPLNAKTKAMFRKELDFWLKDSVGLAWTK
jgi:hypothetical protein